MFTRRRLPAPGLIRQCWPRRPVGRARRCRRAGRRSRAPGPPTAPSSTAISIRSSPCRSVTPSFGLTAYTTRRATSRGRAGSVPRASASSPDRRQGHLVQGQQRVGMLPPLVDEHLRSGGGTRSGSGTSAARSSRSAVGVSNRQTRSSSRGTAGIVRPAAVRKNTPLGRPASDSDSPMGYERLPEQVDHSPPRGPGELLPILLGPEDASSLE